MKTKKLAPCLNVPWITNMAMKLSTGLNPICELKTLKGSH